MNNLVAFGDSFTRGSELSDCIDTVTGFNNLSERELEIFSKHNAGPQAEIDFNHNCKTITSCYSRKTWSAFVANYLNLKYICHAVSGCSNETILRKIMQYMSFISNNDFVIVNWTYIDRWDFVDATKLIVDQQWETILPTNKNKSSFEKFYFKYIQSELLFKWESLKNIYFVITLLQNKNINFLMTCNDKLILDDVWHAPSYIKNMQNEIKDNIVWFDGNGFDDWCTGHNFPRGKENNHPLEEAHVAAFEYIKDNYDFTK